MRQMLDPAVAGLLRAFKAADTGIIILGDASSVPWASMTFEGARHQMTLRFVGDDAEMRARRLAAALPEMDFRLSGHLVAEVAEIVRVEAELHFSVLTLVDA